MALCNASCLRITWRKELVPGRSVEKRLLCEDFIRWLKMTRAEKCSFVLLATKPLAL